ncbi:MAG: DNA methyltransferase [Candidatus Micrarchaeota archaeon]
MVLSPNEVRRRAIAFVHEWKDETRERAEAQTFWNEFFDIFGITRRRVATFEKPSVSMQGGKGFIDLFWKGKLVVEHKSAGQNLDKAYSQALGYFSSLEESELPEFVIVTDFKKIRLYDLDEDSHVEFELGDLPKKINLFDFIPENRRVIYTVEDPVNIKAAELMGRLHDSLKKNGYQGHDLEILLVRLVFCLFADDTGIFEKDKFHFLIDKKTNPDGSDTGSKIIELFDILNTSELERQQSLDEDLGVFPYIDGSLFEERIKIPSFNNETRKILLDCCSFNWELVSPAIFGSMFQSVMDQEERHSLGAHYTSEKNILKTINGLFLENLTKEFENHKKNKQYLKEMLIRVGKIKVLDSACGCGNFLIIAYRELRRLQIKIRKQLVKLEGREGQQLMNISFDEDLNVDSMYGIELLEFPARIAQVGLWLMDHLINMELSKEFGLYYKRLPLRKTANVKIGNALRLDWQDFVRKEELSYIIGNPPFVSKQDRDTPQQEDMDLVCKNIDNYGLLDYVCCWYIKAAEYIQGTNIGVALVSTNSIAQGEQAGIIWFYLLKQKQIKINFAHRTFRWHNDARGKAQVFVVIIGFSLNDAEEKFLFEYETPNSEPIPIKAKHINSQLIDFDDVFIFNRNEPLCSVPKISFGSMPNDDGNLLFTAEEMKEFIKKEPDAKKFIKPLISAKEFLHGEQRWCLWLKDASPSELNRLTFVKERIEKVKQYRKSSKREATIKLAEQPALFGEIRQPNSDYIFIPLTTSEGRHYIPMAFLTKNYIVNNTCSIIPNAELYHFGILMSSMHMAWVSAVCGRMKGDYRYSNNLVYNNFPWPKEITTAQKLLISRRAKEVLTARESFKGSTLADLYNPLAMPKKLLVAHKKLDLAVEKLYSKKKLKTQLEKLTVIFGKYLEYEKPQTKLTIY